LGNVDDENEHLFFYHYYAHTGRPIRLILFSNSKYFTDECKKIKTICRNVIIPNTFKPFQNSPDSSGIAAFLAWKDRLAAIRTDSGPVHYNEAKDMRS